MKKLRYGAWRYGPDVYSFPQDRVVFRRARGGAMFLGIVIVGVVLWISTQMVAAKLHYAVALGKPLAGRLYEPWASLGWMVKFSVAHYHSHTLEMFVGNILLQGVVVDAIGVVFAIVVGSFVTRRMIEYSPRPPELRGSAHWASPDEIYEMGLLPE